MPDATSTPGAGDVALAPRRAAKRLAPSPNTNTAAAAQADLFATRRRFLSRIACSRAAMARDRCSSDGVLSLRGAARSSNLQAIAEYLGAVIDMPPALPRYSQARDRRQCSRAIRGGREPDVSERRRW